jgi:hypothetical protein
MGKWTVAGWTGFLFESFSLGDAEGRSWGRNLRHVDDSFGSFVLLLF